MKKKAFKFLIFIILLNSVLIPNLFALKVDKSQAIQVIEEIEENCDDNCNKFLLSTFKNKIVNNLNNTSNFLKKLANDIQWAQNNDCLEESNNVKDLVKIVSDKINVKTRENPRCRFTVSYTHLTLPTKRIV